MLHNPKWDKPKTDWLELSSLIAWLEQQPADETYQFAAGGHCLLAQYFQHCGFERPYVGRFGAWLGDMPICELPPHWDAIACGENFDTSTANRSYGAALARARAVMA